MVSPSEVDLIVRGGIIVTETASFLGDLSVKSGCIFGVHRPGGAPQATMSFDAKGMYVLPGLVDAHTHLQINFGGTAYRDDYFSGTVAAAFNGTTSIIDFVFPAAGEGLLAAIQKEAALAEGSAVIDFGFHATLLPSTPEPKEAISQAVQSGFPSFKAFMTYGRHGLMSDDGFLYEILLTAARAGGVIGVHAENDAIAEHLTASYLAAGNTGPDSFPRSKPSFVEVEAIRRAIFLANQAHCPLHIFHLSTAGGVEEVRRARAAGQAVTAETCPHYLVLDSDVHERADGANFIVSPPLRPKQEQIELWRGLRDGTLSAVATDHAPLNSSQKQRAASFAETPNGLAGIELGLPLLYTFGVEAGRLGIEDIVRLMSAGPARTFGLYPRKGSLLPGSDADIVVVARSERRTVSADKLHMNVDHTAYDGTELAGWPVMTVCRGEVVVRDGVFCGARGHGRLLKRRLSLHTGEGTTL